MFMLRNFYKQLKARLTKQYRVELIDDLTLSQSKQLFLKPITVAWIGGLLFLGIVGGTIIMFIFTPALHQLIPNYRPPAEIAQSNAVIDSMVNELEQRYKDIEAYEASIKVVAGFDGASALDFSQERLDSIRQAQQEKEDAQNFESQGDIPEYSGNPSQNGVGASQVVYIRDESGKGGIKSEEALVNLYPPLMGVVEDTFRIEAGHLGIDISSKENSIIKSIAEGFVVISEYSVENGWVIGVVSKGNVVSFYKHNSRLLKKAGTYVYKGEPIAVIGNTGENSTGIHLHLEIWHNGIPVNPGDFIEINL
jgi:murein DD-endopeptidase MepM/ murein hydrolase activator NlpD